MVSPNLWVKNFLLELYQPYSLVSLCGFSIKESKRKILYETFNVAKGEWDNTEVVSPYQIKTQREKIAREKLKTKEK